MPVIEIKTKKELVEMLPEGALATVERWLERGDGVACYQNQAMDSSQLGHRKFVSYGSAAAQLETDANGGKLPERLPDIGNQIHWAYTLIATYREGKLP